MSIDWTIAGPWAETAHAIALGESGCDPNATGDLLDATDPLTNRARGLFQWHPASFQEAYGACARLYRPDVEDSWLVADLKAFAAFMELHAGSRAMSLEKGIMAFHLGVEAVMRGDWDQAYLDRYDANLNRVRGMKQ